MSRKISTLMALSLVLSAKVFADSTGTIFRVVCHATGVSPVCHVSLNGTPTTLAACTTSGWHYTFDGSTTEGKNVLSIILAAQLSKQTITIGRKGVCTLAGGSEDLRHVYITTLP